MVAFAIAPDSPRKRLLEELPHRAKRLRDEAAALIELSQEIGDDKTAVELLAVSRDATRLACRLLDLAIREL